jgi:hypothetical protein
MNQVPGVPALEYETFVSDIASAIARQFQLDRHTPIHNVVIQAVSASPPAELYCLDHEKVVWHYPDTAARLIEEVP